MRKRKQLILIFVLSVFVFSLSIYYFLQKKLINNARYKVQFAYHVSSIDPSIYDDWESSFIGNHIYYRLLPEENKPHISYITQTLSAFVEPVADLNTFINTFRDMKDIKSMQAFCKRFVEEKGFENESVLETFLLWQEEIGELAHAIRKSTGIKTNEESIKRRSNLEHEMADCLKYLLILSNKLEVDLLKAFRNKQLIDVKRVWSVHSN